MPSENVLKHLSPTTGISHKMVLLNLYGFYNMIAEALTTEQRFLCVHAHNLMRKGQITGHRPSRISVWVYFFSGNIEQECLHSKEQLQWAAFKQDAQDQFEMGLTCLPSTVLAYLMGLFTHQFCELHHQSLKEDAELWKGESKHI